jgi:hypothetical protein
VRSAPEGRVQRLDFSCPNCACEHGAVGTLAGATAVNDSETLYCVVVTPPDEMDGPQLAFTMLTHAERSGLSVLRENASNEEFVRVAQLRLKGSSNSEARSVWGVAEIKCSAVRALKAGDCLGRVDNDRLFCVYDTDDESQFHAEIYQTSPRGLSKSKTEAVRKRDRQKLLSIYRAASIIKAEDFRGGFLKALETLSPK